MRRYLIPFLLSFCFLIVGIFTLSDYGINWDAGNHMLRASAYANYFLTGNKYFNKSSFLSPVMIRPGEYISRYNFNALEGGNIIPANLPQRPLFDKSLPTFYQSNYWNENYLTKSDKGHPPFVDILSGFSNKIFHQILKVLPDIESYQLVYVIFGAIGVFVVGAFTYDLTNSRLAGLISGLSLATFPIFFAESHFNMKDPPQASLFIGSLWTFWRWVKENNPKWFYAFTFFTAAALGIKWNIIFLSLILLPWLFLIRRSPEFKRWFGSKLIIYVGIFLVINLVFFILIWPYSWNKPLSHIASTINYYFSEGRGSDRVQPAGFVLPLGFNSYPLLLLITQTPTILLLQNLISFWAVLKNRIKLDLNAGYLLMFMILIPVVRVSLPGVWFYSGLRQIMEVLPAISILSGIGAFYLFRNIKNSLSIGINILLLFSYIMLGFNLFKLHPNENTYFNVIAGGLSGAVKKNLVDWTLTYGNIYREGVDWLNANAEQNANIAHLDGSMFAISPVWLRSDISLSPYHFSGFNQKGEYILLLSNPLDPPAFSARFLTRFLNPIHTMKVDGVGLLYIYQNDSRFLKNGNTNEQSLTNFTVKPLFSPKGDYFEINLGREIQVTRIKIKTPFLDCMAKGGEIIRFVKDGGSRGGFLIKDLNRQGSNVYVSNEHSLVGKDIEIPIPAEPAKYIEVYPQNASSCFVRGVISSIKYLPK